MPQQYNKKTGQEENLTDPGVQMSKRTFLNTDLRKYPVPLTHGEQVVADYKQKLADQALIDAQNPSKVTPEQLASLGTLTPEQQAIANANPNTPSGVNPNLILSSAIEKGTLGAIGGATAGGTAGSIIPGVGTAIGAVGGGVAGAVGGIAYGTFAAIKDTTAENVAGIDRNVANAKYNLNTAAIKARKGAPYEVIKKIEGDNLAALDLAERQYKEQSKKLFDTKSKKKMEDLQKYKENVLPGVQYNIQIALTNPNKNADAVDYGLDADGNPIDPTGELYG